MLADSLPDRFGKALLNQHLALQGRSEATAVESLCYLGRRCMGALEFEPVLSQSSDQVKYEIDSMILVASEALKNKESFVTNIRDDEKKAVSDILMLSSSAGGQRAKAVIAYNPQTGEVRSGQTEAPKGFLHYLIKLDGVNYGTGLTQTNNYGRLEYSFYKLALTCGIDMTECNLLQENGRAHFLTRRFDRPAEGGKLHMQTLCGIAHYDFNSPAAYSYEQAFNIINGLGLGSPAKQQMYRRTVFNVVVRNQDDHTKNISFLMNHNGQWSLSPAYDMGFNYNPVGTWTSHHQMSINGKTDDISYTDLMSLAERYDIKEADAIIRQTIEASRSWEQMARECGVPQESIAAITPHFKSPLP